MKLLALVALLALPAAAAAQQPTRAEPSPTMKKLAVLAGEWRGTSWQMVPGKGRVKSDSWEGVESKLGGLVLQVHGKHSSLEAADSGTVTHEAVAMIFYDGTKKQLRVIPVRMDGGTVDTWANETEKGLDWGFALPNGAGHFRYSVDMSVANKWIETGEYSRDGTTWMPVIGLDLSRVR